MMGHCGGGWANWVWMTETFLLWALVITAVVLVVRHLISSRNAGAAPATDAAREDRLLAERARGEIDDAKHQKRCRCCAKTVETGRADLARRRPSQHLPPPASRASYADYASLGVRRLE